MTVGDDQRQAAHGRRQQGVPLHPEPDVRSGRQARCARRVLPRQARRRLHPRRVRRSRADQPRVPRAGGAPQADGRAAARRAASCSRRSASASKRRCCTTPTRCTTSSTRSTSGCTTTGRSTTRTASTRRRTSACRIPSAPMQEVEWALEHGAHVVVMRSGPVRGPGFGRSPGDAVYDPMWARLAEAGILAAYHSGDAGYGRYADEWGSRRRLPGVPQRPVPHRDRRPPPDLRHDRRARVPRRVHAGTRTCASRRSRAAPTGCRCCCTR